MDLTTLTDAELKAELQRRKKPKNAPLPEPQVFYKIHNRSYMRFNFEIVTVTLREGAKRWEVLDGGKYVRSRRFLNKSEGWKFFATAQEALVEIINRYAEAAGSNRLRELWEARHTAEYMEACREHQRTLLAGYGITHDPLDEALRKSVARFEEMSKE